MPLSPGASVRAPATAAPALLDAGWAQGMGLIKRIAGNARLVTDSASKVPRDVGRGDAIAGMCIDFYGRSEAEWTRHCTYSDPSRFFSYRRSVHAREADYGRLIAVIALPAGRG